MRRRWGDTHVRVYRSLGFNRECLASTRVSKTLETGPHFWTLPGLGCWDSLQTDSNAIERITPLEN